MGTGIAIVAMAIIIPAIVFVHGLITGGSQPKPTVPIDRPGYVIIVPPSEEQAP